ncbi:MAG: DUF447 domain-containing protein [Haloarculaceae archaeon]
MSGERADGESVGWPVELRGITETVVTTLGPNDRWNVAALGIDAGDIETDADDTVTARTWGRTRTWRNFRDRGEGYVQFTRDPVDFVEAALAVREQDDPILDSADAWVRVTVEQVQTGEDGGTEWVEWALRPVESAVRSEIVPSTNRGHAAVIEATVAASRLDVDAYERTELVERLRYFERVVDRCGGPAERRAFDRLRDLVDDEW